MSAAMDYSRPQLSVDFEMEREFAVVMAGVG
jgi:hypothetical protein